MEAWQTLSININMSNDFECRPEGPASSISSDFSSSGSLTSSSTSPYSSRRPSRCSGSWISRYPPEPSSMISTSPTTPVGTDTFSLTSFPDTSQPPFNGSGLHWYKPMASHTIDDRWSTIVGPGDEWSNVVESDEMKAFRHSQVLMDVMNANPSIAPPDISAYHSFPGMSGLPDVSELASDAYHPPYQMFDTPCANPDPDSRFYSISDSDQQSMTISPSQTLVNRPFTPPPTLATAFQTPIKMEQSQWQAQFHEQSSPMNSPTNAVFDLLSVPHSASATSNLEFKQEREKKGTHALPYRVSKGTTGETIFHSSKGQTYHIDHVANGNAKTNVCHLLNDEGQPCKKGFQRREHLTRHLRTHKVDLTDPCPVCGKQLMGGRKDNLKAHIEKCHLQNAISGRRKRTRTVVVNGEEKEVRVTIEWLKQIGYDIEGTVKKKVKKGKWHETQRRAR